MKILGAMVSWAGGALNTGCVLSNRMGRISRIIKAVLFTLLSIA